MKLFCDTVLEVGFPHACSQWAYDHPTSASAVTANNPPASVISNFFIQVYLARLNCEADRSLSETELHPDLRVLRKRRILERLRIIEPTY